MRFSFGARGSGGSNRRRAGEADVAPGGCAGAAPRAPRRVRAPSRPTARGRGPSASYFTRWLTTFAAPFLHPEAV